MKNSRRDFIKHAGLGIIGTYFGSSLLSSCSSPAKKGEGPFANLGVQVYSIRDLMQQDPKLSLETIAKIGYSHIETYGLNPENSTFWGLSIADLKKVLTDNNLQTHSGHYDFSKYLDPKSEQKENIEKYFEVAAALGQKYVIAPTGPMNDINALTPADYQYAAEQLNKAGEIAKKSGLKVGYHNHFWEFIPLGNGTKGLDILLTYTDPELVDFELDIYWIEKAGLAAQSYFNKYPGRFKMWHIKDMDKQRTTAVVSDAYKNAPLDSIFKEIKYTEVGTGAIDYINIAKSAKQSGLEFAFVEQDDIYLPNKFESLQKSFDFVQKQLTK